LAGGLLSGFVSSPVVAAYGFERGFRLLMVTGSRIADERNIINFNMLDGEVIKPEELAMQALEVGSARRSLHAY